ncbi:MAG TPA: LptF/LptG family permease [Gemmatimonadaceae bacterium]
MKIISRYVLKEHVGPFVFALSALTSLLLLQYIARRFGDIVGKGLSWQTITEFFLLSIPFTLAMTVPMSVLVAVLYAFSRLASENEITAFKAGGISSRALMRPAVVASAFLAAFMLYFLDQLLPRANHELATLQTAILRTKPTFALKPQVINTIREGQLYLRPGQIDEASGLMHDVTIYDLQDVRRRKTIYAERGTLAFAQNRRDLDMRLFNGLMLTIPDDNSGQLSRVYYNQDFLKVRDVVNQFQSIDADTSMKGDREMSVCEMQRGYEMAHGSVRRAYFDSVSARWRELQTRGSKEPEPKIDSTKLKAGGIGALYCSTIRRIRTQFHVRPVQAAELGGSSRPGLQQQLQPQQQQPQQQQPQKAQQHPQRPTQQKTLQKPHPRTQQTPQQKAQQKQPAAQPESILVLVNDRPVKVLRNAIPDSAYDLAGNPIGKAVKPAGDTTKTAPAIPPAGAVSTPGGARGTMPTPVQSRPALATPGRAIATPARGAATPTPVPPTPTPAPATPPPATTATADTTHGAPEFLATNPEILEAKARLDEARHRRNRYGIEIQKKFSLAASCIVFVLVGAPLALRFPRGGVGLVIGASFFVFAVYYVGLIGGESLANKNIISPFWAMWADNIVFLIVGLILIARMGNEGVTTRGGKWGEVVDATREWFSRQGRRGRVGTTRRVTT